MAFFLNIGFMEKQTNSSQKQQKLSEAALALMERQKLVWPLFAANYQALQEIEIKDFEIDGFRIRVQYNPTRIVSSGAKVDARSIRERKCFLCQANLPDEQESLILDGGYLLLCNPFPIFKTHFTIPSVSHVPQSILSRLTDFLRITCQLDRYTVFYNGPRCGASAPDHAHFQAGTRSQMPIDDEITEWVRKSGCIIADLEEASLFSYTHYLRNGFLIEARTMDAAISCFHTVYNALEIKPGEIEPMMNVICYYKENRWFIAIIPRKLHRPWQYEAEADERFLSSPGAADMGGLFITSRPEDFERVSVDLLRDIYRQVSYSDEEIERIGKSICSAK